MKHSKSSVPAAAVQLPDPASLQPGALTVLMTVYHQVDPAHLQQALASLAAQTRPADEVILVEDGPLGAELKAVLAASPVPLRRLALAENMGSGPASQAGLALVGTEYLARLDADDVALPERFATQLAYLEQFQEIDVLGTAVAEFDSDSGQVLGVRTLPEYHRAIARYARLNSPVNNPSVLMRTAAVVAVGGYCDVPGMEDYDLWARLLAAGYSFHNLPAPLTRFRMSNAVFGRRTSPKVLRAEWQLQQRLVSYGLISKPRAVANVLLRNCYRLLPAALLKRLYHVLFHR